MTEPNASIPAVAHFFWMGRSLPCIYRFAVMSAVRNGGFSGGVRLHHTDPLDDDTVLWARQQGNFSLVPCALDHLLTEVHGPALAKLCADLVSPVARSNLFRAAIVLREGGVYLDLDTITVRPLGELLQTTTAFVGDEYIVFPRAVAHSRNPLVLTAAGLRTGLRDVLRRLPRSYLWFARVAPLYHRAVNGALLGGIAGHAWLRADLDAMLEVPPRAVCGPMPSVPISCRKPRRPTDRSTMICTCVSQKCCIRCRPRSRNTGFVCVVGLRPAHSSQSWDRARSWCTGMRPCAQRPSFRC